MRKVLILFGVLDDSDIEWLVETGERRRIPDGEVIIQEGVEGESLFIVLEGRFAITLERFGGKRVAVVSTGDVLGEMSFLDSRPTSATVSAMGEAVVLQVSTEEIRWQLDDEPGFAARFYRALALVLSGKMRSFTLVGAVDGDENAMKTLEEEDAESQLSPEILGAVHLAGSRFERLLRKST